MKKAMVAAAIAMGAMTVPSIASASSITFTGSNGSLSASATFASSGNDLIVTLTNTSNIDVTDAGQVLTAVFFDLNGLGTLTRTSAVVAPGSSVVGNGGLTGPGNSVGGEWAYTTGIAGPGSATEGISSSGLGLFGPGDVFPGSGNLQGPVEPDGVQYGITSGVDNPLTGNGSISGAGLINNSVVITLTGIGGFDPAAANAITHVNFQFGTALDEPNAPGRSIESIDPVPEPATLAMFGTGLAIVVARLRKARR